MTDQFTSLVSIIKEPGVHDLQPMMVKSLFAKALKAERENRLADAQESLDKACAEAVAASAKAA